MQFQVTFKNMPFSASLSHLTQSKMTQVLEKYASASTRIQIVFWIDKDKHCAQAHLSGVRQITGISGSTLQAQAHSNFMYQTVDLLLGKLQSQLRRVREKPRSRRIRSQQLRSTYAIPVDIPISDSDGFGNSDKAEVMSVVFNPGFESEAMLSSLEAGNVLQYEKARQKYYQFLKSQLRASPRKMDSERSSA